MRNTSVPLLEQLTEVIEQRDCLDFLAGEMLATFSIESNIEGLSSADEEKRKVAWGNFGEILLVWQRHYRRIIKTEPDGASVRDFYSPHEQAAAPAQQRNKRSWLGILRG